MSSPPFPMVCVGPIVRALGEAAGALKSQLRPETFSLWEALLPGTR